MPVGRAGRGGENTAAAGLVVLALLALGGCGAEESPRLDVVIAGGPEAAGLEDLVVFLQAGTGRERRVGAGVFHLGRAGLDLGSGSVELGLRTPDGLAGATTVHVVGCAGPARCETDLVRGPRCACDAPRAFGALHVEVRGPTRRTVHLHRLNPACDRDGDLLVDCRAGACCAALDRGLAALVSDCHDAAPPAGCGRGPCDPREAHPFLPPEPEADAAGAPGPLASRHERWCGDGLDNDCRGGDAPCRAVDADGDGYAAGPDCDDGDPTVHPGAVEVCGDAVDEDCDGVAPDCDTDGDGVYAAQDCDDADPERHPGRPEVCDDGIDQDCSGADLPCLDADIDGDGVECPVDQGGVERRCAGAGLDCDDLDAGVGPGAPERCGDGVDQDCDGVDPPCEPGDADGDGVVSARAGGTDCDDGDPRVHPGAPERCGDGVDQDCDAADAPCAGRVDADGDGWSPPADCDDRAADVRPAADELCNARDDDCDGIIDEANPLRTAPGEPASPPRCGDECPAGPGTCPCRPGPRACQSIRDAGAGRARIVCLGVTAGDHGEACNGVDDDCDGIFDEATGGELLAQRCYEGDPATLDVGVCRAGTQFCAAEPLSGAPAWGPCGGQVLPAEAEACNGRDDDCDGTIDRDGAGMPITMACYDLPAGEPGVGRCQRGLQTCLADGRGGADWGPCEGAVGPRDEICDGVDDDCDEAVDEADGGAPLERPCYTGPPETEGVGACRPGRSICEAGAFGACREEVLPAAAETCDGVDEDCDGEIDESPSDVGEPCHEGEGICRAEGVFVCVDGAPACDAVPGMPAPETCNGRDDDCDGTVDDVPPGASMPCEVGVGACRRRGRTECRDGEMVCTVEPGSPAPEESCNGEDDDCDGHVDEDIPPRPCGPSRPPCQAGRQRCIEGRWGPCEGAVGPGRERCNGEDDDCDGEVDEIFDLQNDELNCGECGHQCPPKGDRCVAGVCRCGEGEACGAEDSCLMERCQ